MAINNRSYLALTAPTTRGALTNREFILASAQDHNDGLVSFTVDTGELGNLTGTAKGQGLALTPVESDSAWQQKKFQQNIQRAAGNVVVTYKDTEYALVADYNFLFNDPHFNADANCGYGKQIGGKIGVIADPFGEDGGPRYLGATPPIPGGAVDHLTLTDDGTLYADAFIDEVTDFGWRDYRSVFTSGMIKALDFIETGGYLERYDVRVRTYNASARSDADYQAFQKANLADALGVLFATVATAGVGRLAVTGATRVGTPLLESIWASASGQAVAAGLVFETLMQAGLTAANIATEGVYSYTPSLSQILMSGTFGGAFSTALGKLGGPIASAFQNAPVIMNAFFAELGRLISPFAASEGRLAPASLNLQLGGIRIGESPRLGSTTMRPGDTSVPSILGKTEIKVSVSGRLVSLFTPEAQSLRLEKAGEWYLGEVRQLDKLIDKTLPPKQQAEEAWQLLSALHQGALAALRDGNVANLFREKYPLRSLGDVALGVGNDYTKALAKLLDVGDVCFMGDTLIWTDKGTVPIKDIKEGDMVLSKPEDGSGGQAYKRVTQTFMHPQQPIWLFEYWDTEDQHTLYATGNHPIWTADEGWCEVKHLSAKGYGNSQELELNDGSTGWTKLATPMYESVLYPGVGWVSPRNLNRKYVYPAWGERREWDIQSKNIDGFNEEPYVADVYNIEVENFHTYYAGESGGPGIWVHNKGIKLFVLNANHRVSISDVAVYFSETELIREIGALKTSGVKYVFLKKPGAEDEAARALAGTQKHTEVFEDGVYGLLIDQDGLRMEIAAIYDNANPNGDSFMKFEGFEKIGNAFRFIDRKVNLGTIYIPIKSGAISGPGLGAQQNYLDVLWRATQVLDKQPAGSRVTYSFETQKALDDANTYIVNKIISDNYGGLEIRVFDGANNNYPTVNPESANILMRIKQAILDGRINLVLADAMNQNVAENPAAVVQPTLTLQEVNRLLPQARQYWLNAGAATTLLNSATFSVSDLPSGLAGITQGHAITLDASGAGWGWFVDASSADETEFQPTGTQGDFIARANSLAENHLDLLTVMIHELGHVLGMPSTVSADNVMSQYLAPGQRRLPDAVDIAALQAEGLPYYTGGTSGTEVIPAPQFAPANSTFTPRALPVNSTLQNTGFMADTTQGWTIDGNVSFSPVPLANGTTSNAITLSETTATQTTLQQAFTLGEHDRFLSFTVNQVNLHGAGTELQSAPADAFEVALLDATTYQPLLDSSGTTGTNGVGANMGALLGCMNHGQSAA